VGIPAAEQQEASGAVQQQDPRRTPFDDQSRVYASAPKRMPCARGSSPE
jgi:hypothetical protein